MYLAVPIAVHEMLMDCLPKVLFNPISVTIKAEVNSVKSYRFPDESAIFCGILLSVPWLLL